MRSGDDDKFNNCGVHGKDPYWVKSRIVKGEVCIECVAAGYYRDDIRDEVRKDYPGPYLAAKAGTLAKAGLRKSR